MTVQIIMAVIGSLLSVWLARRQALYHGTHSRIGASVFLFSAVSNAVFIGVVLTGVLFNVLTSPSTTDIPPFSKTGITFYPKVKP